MKNTIFSLILSSLFICLTGIFVWNALVPESQPESTFFQINQLKKTFKTQIKPEAVLNLDTYYQQAASRELTDPRTLLPRSNYPFNEWQSYINASSTCQFNNTNAIHSEALQKALSWSKFRCHQSIPPESFFATTPFMHPKGISYVKLAVESGLKEFQDPKWISDHKKYFHILERLTNPYLTSNPLHLDYWQLFQLEKNEELTLSDEQVFFLAPNAGINDLRTFLIYPINKWTQFIQNKKWITNINSLQECAYRESNICWIQKQSMNNFNLRIFITLLSIILTILVLLFATFFINQMKKKRQEAKDKLFILQMLTHELRTPTASIKLLVELFRNEYDELPIESQKAFLRLCAETERLRKIVAASTNYLTANATEQTFPQSLYSINHFISNIIDSYASKNIHFNPLKVDRLISKPVYWLELCARNIIDNAFHHGKLPIIVSLNDKNGILSIHIQDQGQTSFETLEEMSKPFSKNNASKGLGLGLAIVQKIVEIINARLIFESKPTTFILLFEDKS